MSISPQREESHESNEASFPPPPPPPAPRITKISIGFKSAVPKVLVTVLHLFHDSCIFQTISMRVESIKVIGTDH